MLATVTVTSVGGPTVTVDDGENPAVTIDGENPAVTITTPGDRTIETADIADEAVTLAKLAHIATARILGRTTAGSGDVEELTAAQALALVGAMSTAGGAFTGPIRFSSDTFGIQDENGDTAILFGAAGSAVNYLTITNGAAGFGVFFEPEGADSNIDLTLRPKGAGKVSLDSHELNDLAAATLAHQAPRFDQIPTALKPTREVITFDITNPEGIAAGDGYDLDDLVYGGTIDEWRIVALDANLDRVAATVTVDLRSDAFSNSAAPTTSIAGGGTVPALSAASGASNSSPGLNSLTQGNAFRAHVTVGDTDAITLRVTLRITPS